LVDGLLYWKLAHETLGLPEFLKNVVGGVWACWAGIIIFVANTTPDVRGTMTSISLATMQSVVIANIFKAQEVGMITRYTSGNDSRNKKEMRKKKKTAPVRFEL
jgi:hypothetical protein